MRKNILLIALSLIITTGLIGCKKDKYDYAIEGKWQFRSVYIFVGGVSSDGYLQWHTITTDSLENDIIYDFQKNNKLLVTSSISGNLQTNEYSYECERRNSSHNVPNYDAIQLKIGKEIYYGSVSQKYGIMSLSSESAKSIKPQKPIDEIDLVLIEQDSLSSWQKQFIKLN